MTRTVNRVYFYLMALLYLTQDSIGTPSGGGFVTKFELEAFSSLGEDVGRIDGTMVQPSMDPFESDERFFQAVKQMVLSRGIPKLVHVYAGCFTTTVEFLKSKGVMVTYTADAHDPDRSIEEFKRCQLEYPWRHMSDKNLRNIYVKGYTLADTVIVPSTHSESVMNAFGCQRIVTIPHPVRPFHRLNIPNKFAVGYLGQGGPDKGLRYLMEAWKDLKLDDAKLIFAGNNIDDVVPLWRRHGGRNIELMGFVENEAEFYGRIAVYAQPSVTEGFGIPVIEAMACGRPVIVSEGTGSVDAVTDGHSGKRVPIRDPKAIASAIRFYKDNPEKISGHGANAWNASVAYDPDSLRDKYISMWRSLWK